MQNSVSYLFPKENVDVLKFFFIYHCGELSREIYSSSIDQLH